MVALAQSITIEDTTYPAGTDSADMPVWAVDRIRNPAAWVGGTAPALSYNLIGKRRITAADLGSAPKARRSLGLVLRSERWAPTGSIADNADRIGSTFVNNTGLLTSGRLQLAGGLVIPAGATVTNISFMSGTQAAATPTAQWFCLLDQNRNVLAKTADATNTAWAANTVKTLALATPYTPTSDMPVYAGIVVVAGTAPDLIGVIGNAVLAAVAPVLAGYSTTGLTNPASLGATGAAITAVAVNPFCYLS